MLDLGVGCDYVLDYFMSEGFEMHGIERSERIHNSILEHIKRQRVCLADLNKNREC